MPATHSTTITGPHRLPSTHKVKLITGLVLGTVLVATIAALVTQGTSDARGHHTSSPANNQASFDPGNLTRTVAWAEFEVLSPLAEAATTLASRGNTILYNEQVPLLVQEAEVKVAPYIGQKIQWEFRVTNVTELAVFFNNQHFYKQPVFVTWSKSLFYEQEGKSLEVGKTIARDHARRLQPRDTVTVEATIAEIAVKARKDGGVANGAFKHPDDMRMVIRLDNLRVP